jgi:hypothetical protein
MGGENKNREKQVVKEGKGREGRKGKGREKGQDRVHGAERQKEAS